MKQITTNAYTYLKMLCAERLALEADRKLRQQKIKTTGILAGADQAAYGNATTNLNHHEMTERKE